MEPTDLPQGDLSDGTESEEDVIDVEAKLDLSDVVTIFPHKKLGIQGNVFEGELKSKLIGPRPCAIKFEQDSKEVQILKALGFYTHIVSLFQSGYCEDPTLGPMFIAIEKCHKSDLYRLTIDRKNEYKVDVALNYCHQIINGIKYIHERLIVHMDLKPSNILLSRDLLNIKIADFGLSEFVPSRSSAIYCSHMFGTCGYRPPESFGKSYASMKSDIYSLGSLFYFLLSNGESPLGRQFELWDYHTKEGIIDTTKMLVPNCETTQHLIRFMLHKERQRRPSIEQIAVHPCWSGQDHPCDFDYGFEKENEETEKRLENHEKQEEVHWTNEEMRGEKQWQEALQQWQPGEYGPRKDVTFPTKVDAGSSTGRPTSSEADYRGDKCSSGTWVQLTKFIKYNLRPLHSGTNVYPAIRKFGKHEQQIVVKIIRHTDKNAEQVDKLLKLEGHPNIVRCLHSDEYPGNTTQMYIATERCRQNLQEYINSTPFLIYTAASFFQQTLSALEYIHTNSIAHRDLKPTNILVSDDGKKIKVSNFGISKEIPVDRSVITVSGPGGDTGFNAPETYLGEVKIGYKVDIYSLAINGYYMMTHGKHPFGLPADNWAVNIAKNNARDLSQIPQFPEPYAHKRAQLLALFERMLHMHPGDRPTASQLQEHDFFACGKDFFLEFR